MGKSIMQTERECYFCGRLTDLERHHVMAGTANKWLSEVYGLWIWCCDFHHRDPKEGVQYNPERNRKLKQEAQKAFQSYYGRKVWMKMFRKNYLDEQEGET